MVIPAATNYLSLASANLRTTLSKSSVVQAWMQVGHETAAILRIYLSEETAPAAEEYTKAELVALRPYIVLWLESAENERKAQGAFVDSGTLTVRFYQNTPTNDPAYTAEEIYRLLENSIGDIIEDMLTLATDEGAGHFLGINWNLEDYGRAHEDVREAQGDFQVMEFSVSYGGA